MREIKWLFLLLAVLAAACLAGIGIAVAERSVLGVIAAIAGLLITMGTGFVQKKKLRENGS
ncbi:hypothetical protein GJU40_05740 [Bacillus lacus]|uniref:YlaF family protein n=1 Tax=Metabacillus lacus TaxID=1983721 RepID=A0A7X2LXU8_9BACI|nr:DUF5325 family protein [Metabacillus lacus]MRX71676.1 hypothetical protein [Metabacillus lacus]